MSFRLAVCAEMVFTDLPLIDRIRRIDAAGFAVEIWGWPGHDAAQLRSTGARFAGMTGYLTGDLIEHSDELLRTAARSIDYAATLGCRTLNLHGTGLDPRGLPVDPRPVVTGADWLAARDTLCRVADLGATADVVFTLENLNTQVDHPGTPFARAADTRALVAAVDNPHLRMNLDLYHAQIGEGNLAELIRDCTGLVAEVQVADVPGRCEPGTGEVNWSYLARVLAETGYDGSVGLEAWASRPGTEGSERALAAFAEAFGPQ